MLPGPYPGAIGSQLEPFRFRLLTRRISGRERRKVMAVGFGRMLRKEGTHPIGSHSKTGHSCDQPSCVNPNHLFPGTQQENLADMHSKGRNRHRSVKCEDNPNAELTAESVLEIRKRHRDGMSFRELSKAFGIHQSQIARICRFKSWRMNGDPAPILGPENERRINVKLSWEKVGQIRNSSDLPIELARKFGVTVGLIHQVRRGLIWKESKKTV